MNDSGESIIPEDAQVVEEMRLTSEQLTDVVDFINAKAVIQNDGCPVCGSPVNFVVEDIYRVAVRTQPVSIAGRYQPLISTVCSNCGFVRFFNQITMLSRIEQEKAATDIETSDQPDGA